MNERSAAIIIPESRSNPRLNRFMADEIPDSELVILKDHKHSILIEGPERVLPPLRDFLLRPAVN